MKRTTSHQNDVYTRITDRIIADLEKGVKSWTKPWSAGNIEGRIALPKRHNGEAYQGINILSLWASSMDQGFTSSIWMTFRQAKELGGHVIKGEKGSLVVYANTLQRTEENENGEEVELQIPYMKGYTVFNVEQIEGLADEYYDKPEPAGEAVERIDHADQFFAATGASIHNGGDRAYYAIGQDHIKLPHIEAFRDAESYYATLAHEMTHWTRHESRLDRDFGRKKWGDEGYAQEELVAELGAAFLCADLGLALEDREDHAAYIGSWLKVLKDDKRAIFHAAAHAQRAVNYLYRLQEGKDKAA
ncbi:ArdC family protein [Marinobacterium sedimentorum]|uniref:ArdC family protein n=1 Tax=Marinobacterium sedimentorum TaxID=2927804 RepID=UPI0020C6CCE0|nr:zincin-like metallopeptidase domain-containing protein [Marinobacterium sedimentorum]MCP8685956.1 zincin-like metallopeptidase domain-containing protein [Marinobacterium sedimentorum]